MPAWLCPSSRHPHSIKIGGNALLLCRERIHLRFDAGSFFFQFKPLDIEPIGLEPKRPGYDDDDRHGQYSPHALSIARALALQQFLEN